MDRTNMFRVGNAGVDIFFVISGFVMWTAQKTSGKRPTTPGTFLRQRIIRVVPLYLPLHLRLAAGLAGVALRLSRA